MIEIKPKYATFDQAKKLKEKRFDEYCRASFKPSDNSFQQVPTQNSILPALAAPEHWQVIAWMLKEKGVDVCDNLSYGKKYIVTITWNLDSVHKGMGNISYYSNQKQLNNNFEGFDTKEDAYSAAFDYILDKII
jgi:hypothetical protein